MIKNTLPLSKRALQTPTSATVLIADIASEMKRKGIKIFDFSAGRAAEHSPNYVNEAASKALIAGDTHQTPAQGKYNYRLKISEKLKRENNLHLDPDKNIIATLGCKNGLTLAMMSILNNGDEVIVEDPCFVSYGATINFFGGKTVPVTLKPENNFRWTVEQLEKAITPKTKCILFCSPQNPTGVVHTEEDLELIAAFAKKHNLWVIADEIYERVTWKRKKHICIASKPGMQERTIGLMGFTKTLSMGGWRIGYAYAPESIIISMIIFQQHLMTCPGSFTQEGATTALSTDYKPEIYELWKDWEKRCMFVADEINKISNLSCKIPEGGFYVWINIKKTGLNSTEFCERLLKEKQVALVPGAAFGKASENYVRMTCVRSWDELKKGLCLIKDFN
ncbi:MAG: pyridoxal phosphate-dependent aminotransferase [Bacteroidota bacterium]